LHFICGKIAAGKSTLARKLASEPGTVLISEDEWLSRLYPGEITALPDYVRCVGRLREAMGGHVEQLLRAGLSVVLDFQANTLAARQWMKTIYQGANAAHCLHYLDVADDECKARLRRRNAEDLHPYTTSDAQYDEITRYFVPPSEEEGFEVIVTYPA
jgi:predicted kinase